MSPHRPENEAEAIELIRSIDVRAPEELHRRTQTLIEKHAQRPLPPRAANVRGRLRLGAALGVTCAAVLALALILSSGGGSQKLSVRTTAALTSLGATMAAPSESPGRRGQLTAAVDGVAFPYWEERFGWRSSGARKDTVGGRTVSTVFYSAGGGRRIGYSIVAGTPVPRLTGGEVHWRGGTPYRLLSENGSRVVAWVRDGHLCVVGGHGISDATLLRLASWEEPGSSA